MPGVDGSYQLIYDTDLNITWLDYTYTNVTQPYQGRDGKNLWASELVVTVNGVSYDEWRLPSTVDESRLTHFTYDGTTSTGWNNPTTSEMSHLFYTELGNKGSRTNDARVVADGEYGLNNTGPFQNLLSENYWSGTVNLLPQSTTIQSNAWFFDMLHGYQGVTDKDLSATHGLAVTSGHIQSSTPVPEPATMLLFGAGLVGLIGSRITKKNR